MRPRILAFAMLLCLCFSMTASADHVLGLWTETGFDMDHATAVAEAHAKIDFVIANLEAQNPDAVYTVIITTWSWEQPFCEIGYFVWVSSM